jgi:hypothetical protein
MFIVTRRETARTPSGVQCAGEPKYISLLEGVSICAASTAIKHATTTWLFHQLRSWIRYRQVASV